MEDQLKGRGLSVVQAQHTRKQKRSEFGDSCTDRHAFAATAQSEQFRRECLSFPVLANACATREELLRRGARLSQTGEVTLDIGDENGDSGF